MAKKNGQYDYIIRKQAPNFASITPEHPNYKRMLGDAYNWINYIYSATELRGFFETYATANNINFNKNSPDYMFNAAGKIAYMLLNGAKLAAFSMETLARNIASLTVVEDGGERKRVTRVSRVPGVIGEIEDWIIEDKYDTTAGAIMALVDGLNKSEIQEVTEAFRARLVDVTDVSNPDIAENIELMGKRVHYVRAAYEDIIRRLSNEELNTRKVERKPRKAKVKPVTKVIERFRFKPADNEFNITSISPEKIIGATTALTFDTRRKTIALFRAAEGQSLAIKGTKIVNYDEGKSVIKNVRKPADLLLELRTATNRRLDGVLAGVKTKAYSPNGSSSEDMVILKVYN